MSDEHDRRPGPDETRQFSPFDEDVPGRSPGGGHPVDGPRPGDSGRYATDPTSFPPPTGGAVPPRATDGTQQMPRVDDETVATPQPPRRDSTAILPREADAWNAPSGPNAAWSGRAEVRAPQPDVGGYTRTEWAAAPPEEPRGRWWMPILIGFLALVLLAALGWGIYLISRASGDDDPAAPVATTTAAETTQPTTEPTTTEPTEPTTEPTTDPATTEPAEPTEVTVPALRGLSRQEAEQALTRRGLTFREISRTSDAAAGTVIDSDPAEGQEVPPDTQVTLVIAVEPTATATATTEPTQDQPDDQQPED